MKLTKYQARTFPLYRIYLDVMYYALHVVIKKIAKLVIIYTFFVCCTFDFNCCGLSQYL